MKAIVKTRRERGAVEVLEVPDPPAPVGNEIRIRVMSSAICGSDLHSHEYIPSSRGMAVPVILGHEASGVVEAVGPEVRSFRAGDRVMGESNQYCGDCANCRAGKSNICLRSLMRGIDVDGAMAEIITLNEPFAHRLPDGLSFDDAAVAQPVSVSLHGVCDNCEILPGDAVAVFGPGVIGQAAAQLARARGASRVVVVGTGADAARRLPIAESMGFPTVNAREGPIGEAVARALGQDAADVVIECSGAPPALSSGIGLLRKGGRLTVLSIFSKPVEIDLAQITRKELRLSVSYTSTWNNYERALALLADGILAVGPLCKSYPFERAEEAFQDAISKAVLKPILRFNGT